jgi:hypothetical protein
MARVVGLGGDDERRLGQRFAQRLDLAQIDMLARRRGDQHEIEALARLAGGDDLGGTGEIDDAPAGVVLGHRQLEAFAPQLALIDERQDQLGLTA